MGFLTSAPAPSPSSHFGPANEVRERLHCQALQRLSGLNEALVLFILSGHKIVIQKGKYMSINVS
jgi:hypothetical protein